MSADLQRIIKIIFQGEDQSLKAFLSVNKNIKGVADDVASLTGPFADAAKNILKVQTAVGAALVAIGGFSISAAGEFDDGINEINSLMGLAGEDLDRFRQDIRNYFRDSVFDMDDVLRATYQSISLGIPNDVVTQFLKSAENLAIAGDVELTKAVNLLANTANAYGGTMDDVAGYADTFFSSVKAGGVTIDTLEASFGKVAAFAGPFGISLEDAASALTSLVAMGVGDTAESATALATLIQNLVDPSDQAAAAAKELGIELGADIFRDKTLAEVMEEIGEKTGGSAGEIQRIIGSSNALKAALPLVRDEAGRYANAIEAMGGKHGAVSDAAKIMAKNLSTAHSQVSKSVKDVLIGIGLPLLDDYKESMGGISELFKGVSIGLDQGAFDPLLGHFSGVLQDVGKFAADVAKVLPDALAKVDWTQLIKSFEAIGGAFGDIFEAIFGDVDLTTVDGLAQGIQNAVNALTGLNNLSAGILSQLPPFFSALQSFATFVVGLDPGTFKAIGTALGAALLINIGATTISSISTAIGGAAVAIKGLGAIKAGATLTALATGMGAVAAAAAPFAAAFAGGAAVGTGINAVVDRAVKTFTGADSLGGLIYRWVHGDGSETLEKGGEDFERILDALRNNISKFDLGDLRQKLEDLGHDLGGLTDLDVLELGVDLDEVSYNDLMALIRTRASEEDVSMPVAVDVAYDFDEHWDHDFWDSIAEKELAVQVKAEADQQSIDATRTILGTMIGADGIERVIYAPEVEPASLAETEKTIEQILKEREIEIQFDVAKIKANAEVVQSAIEWKAKLDIANVELETERIKGAFESIGTTIESTGTLIGELFGILAGENRGSDLYNLIQNQLQEENRMRREAHELQMDLTREQLDAMRLRREAMERGDAMISIDGQGLQPHLEAFMWEILAAIQTRVNEEGLDMLMGTQEAAP